MEKIIKYLENNNIEELDFKDIENIEDKNLIEQFYNTLMINTSLTKLFITNYKIYEYNKNFKLNDYLKNKFLKKLFFIKCYKYINYINYIDYIIDDIYNYLLNNNTLINLTIRACKLNKIDYKLCNILKNNKSIQILDLSHNKIENIDNLCNCLKYNNTLTKLNLSNNKIKDVNSLYDLLIINNSIEKLYLSFLFDNLFDDDINSNNKINNINKLFDALKFNNSLKLLELKHNNIDDINNLSE